MSVTLKKRLRKLGDTSVDENLERLPAGYLIFRNDGVIIAANRTLHDILGYGETPLEGFPIESLFSLPSRIFYQTHLFPLLKMQDRVDEIYVTLRSKSGESLPVLLNARSVGTGEDARNECIVMPVQNRDRYEEEILRARKELEALSAFLEDRVRERTAKFELLIRELNALTYSIAHNLRAPLRAIISTSAILHEEHLEGLTVEQITLLNRQRHNVEVLSSQINDVLHLSRLASQTPVKRKVDISLLGKDAAQAAVKGREKEFDLNIQPGISAWADTHMMATVLDCLMSNAVKYSPLGGTITLRGESDDTELTCLIKDEGIGIEPQYGHRIFEPFERLHREEFPGNGVGLAIVERVIRHHGGRVWVESAFGVGSTFGFTLPLTKETLEADALGTGHQWTP